MARSMLLFAKGMPLGENGLNWLKIHLINLTGLKKKYMMQYFRFSLLLFNFSALTRVFGILKAVDDGEIAIRQRNCRLCG